MMTGLLGVTSQAVSYEYQPLVGQDAIRLLVLHPAEDLKAKVKCSIVYTTLRECDDDIIEHYSALSYVWGNPDDTRVISVEGRDFEITANLDSALRHIRNSRRNHRIWADAVCINQSDDMEKSQQVKQMGDVYRFAHNTIIYLGESTLETDQLLLSARSLGGSSEYSLAWILLLERPWFTRVWIYQELMFSRDPWVQCGIVRVRWDRFFGASSSHESFTSRVEPWKTFHTLATERRNLVTSLKQKDEHPFSDSLLRVLEARRGLGGELFICSPPSF